MPAAGSIAGVTLPEGKGSAMFSASAVSCADGARIPKLSASHHVAAPPPVKATRSSSMKCLNFIPLAEADRAVG